MKTTFRAVLATASLAAGMVFAGPAFATTNLITNGDFSAGNTGFTSDYTYVSTPGPYALYGAGSYTVGANAANYHNLWVSYGDHTTGTGNYLIVNGATDPSPTTNIWESNELSLAAGTYTFSAWTANSCCNANFSGENNAPNLYFVGTNGSISLVPTPAATGTPGVWYETALTFTLPNAVTGYVALRNGDGEASGNDFGLDDVSLTSAVPEPVTWAMMIGGFGLIGGIMRRTHRKSEESFTCKVRSLATA